MKTLDNFFKTNGFVGGIIIIVVFIAIAVILWNKFSNSQSSYEPMASNTISPANVNNPVKEFQPVTNSNQLLPKDKNSEWSSLNPSGTGELSNINLLKSGWQIGIDTVGQTLRNANLQLRSEPPNPQVSVGPWNNSTITPDFMRVPLEIGAGPQ
jgi:hypothetical protein